VVQIDHTQSDVEVVDRHFRLSISRRWLTVAIDIATLAARQIIALQPPARWRDGNPPPPLRWMLLRRPRRRRHAPMGLRMACAVGNDRLDPQGPSGQADDVRGLEA
jgi:hypothetical protein